MSEGQCLQMVFTGAFVSDIDRTSSLTFGYDKLDKTSDHCVMPSLSEPLTSPRTFDGSDSSRSRSTYDDSQGSPSSAESTCHQSFSALPADLLIQDYYIEGVIGQGRFGSVWKCVEKSTGELFACKQLVKGSFEPQIIVTELECLARAQGHRNILQLENVYESPDSILILTEMCKAGDLYDHILNKKFLSESEARRLFRDVVAAVHHCHTNGVMHRDLKPENILLQTDPATGQKCVRLADFGLATVLRPDECTIGAVGSKPYDAPEVAYFQPYDFKADMFSLGVVLFSMLSGRWPHFDDRKVLCPKLSFGGFIWNGVTPEAKDLMTRLMSHDPSQRPTTEELLSDPWFATGTKAPSEAGSPCDHFSRHLDCEADSDDGADADHHPADVAVPQEPPQEDSSEQEECSSDRALAADVSSDVTGNPVAAGAEGKRPKESDPPRKSADISIAVEGAGYAETLLGRFCHVLCLALPTQGRN